MASLKEVKRLKELCEKYELEGRGVLDGFPNTKLASMYNGIGPEKFPGWLRARPCGLPSKANTLFRRLCPRLHPPVPRARRVHPRRGVVALGHAPKKTRSVFAGKVAEGDREATRKRPRTKESFAASNKRFKRNGYKVACAEYAWYNPRRCAVMNQARRFGNICQSFGWAAWRMCQSRSDLGSGEAVSAQRKFERSENHARSRRKTLRSSRPTLR